MVMFNCRSNISYDKRPRNQVHMRRPAHHRFKASDLIQRLLQIRDDVLAFADELAGVLPGAGQLEGDHISISGASDHDRPQYHMPLR